MDLLYKNFTIPIDYTFDFIFYFINPEINFSQFFIFYFLFLTGIFFLKNYLYQIRFVIVEFPFILLSVFLFMYLILFTTDFVILYFYLEGLGFSTYILFGL